MVLNQLSVMTGNGMEIADALDRVAEHCDNDAMADCLDDILDAVGGGTALSAAVAQHGTPFPVSLAPMLASAEATGNVPQVLRRACSRMREEMQLRSTILGAMIYPLLLVSTSGFVLVALILGVLPQFGSVFENMGRDVPASTAALLTVGEIAREHWMAIFGGAAALAVTLSCLRRSPLITRPIARFLMNGPLIRSAYRPLQAGRQFRTLASMVAGGVPLLDAVRLTKRSTTDPFWRKLLADVQQTLVDGRQASEVLFKAEFLPSEAAALFSTAEQSGRVAEVLEDVGAFYEEEASRRIKRLITMIEPMIILGMGVIVAGIVLSVMLPLMDVSTIEA